MNNFLKNQWHHIVSVLLVIFPALYSTYPLVFSDSGTYIDSAITLKTPLDRPLGYGIFIHIFSWKHTLWPIVFAQGIMASFLIWNLLFTLLSKIKIEFLKITYIAISLLLALTSSLPWYASQIMPDIFISFGGLALIILLFKKNIILWKYCLLIFILFFCFISHLSHLMILFLVLAFFFLFHRKNESFKKARSKKWVFHLILVFILSIGSVLFMTISNYRTNNQFKPTNATNLFILGRLAESGLLQEYLNQHCSESEALHNLCLSRPKNTSDVLWNEKSPIGYYNNDWIKADSAVKSIVYDILSTPKYLFHFIYDCFRNTLIQSFQIKIGGGISSYGDNSAPYSAITQHIWAERNYFLSTNQSFDLLYFNFFNILNLLAILFSILVFSYGFIYKKLTPLEVLVFRFLLLVYFFNAFITATLVCIFDRLQARVSWPLVFLALIIFSRIVYNHYQQRKVEQ